MGACQYQLIENARICLQLNAINSTGREIVYNYKINMLLSVLLLQNEQNGVFNAEDTLVEGGLDYLYQLRRLVLSKDQPGHRECVITALGK